MAKPGTKLTEASANLIELNTKLHEIMADIINQKQEKEGIAVIPHSLVLSAHSAGNAAVLILSSYKPDAPELVNIKLLTDTVGKVIEVIPSIEGKLTMTSEAASDLNSVILNNLANQVHDAGMSLVGITKQLQACSVSELEPTEAFAVSKYCSGVLPNITHEVVVTKVPLQYTTVKGKKEILSYPSHISHKLGVHRVEISTVSKDGEAKVAVQYKESGPQYHDMPGRQKGVHDRLVKEGFTCNVGKGEDIPFGKDLTMYCWGEVEKEKLRRLATFFSLLLNADIAGMGKDTAPVVSDKTWDIAVKLNQQYGDKTWQSGQGMLHWPSVHKEWQDEKVIYEKIVIYKDLRDLAIIRDKHHELIEEAYGVEAVHALGLTVTDPTGVKKVIDNAKKALEIFKKNKWPHEGLDSSIASLDAAVKAGQKKLMPMVDGVGHTMHYSIANLVAKEKQYGGCLTAGADMTNINAGNLAYCEGVLKGTSATTSKSGNLISHKVLPETYQVFILDEMPDGSYNINVNIPAEEGWNNQLRKFLKENKKFSCHASGCKANIKNLDDIRDLALLLSNLRGASGAIGDECAEKAMGMARDAAKTHNEKGVFAFTQEPIMPNAKAWIDMCQKTYGILPPGLTEEEKEMLLLLGPEKVYAGCSFAETDIIPNKGILVYCEGVRKNPQAEISAYLNPKGELEHYYHNKLDQIANVNIVPIGEGKYQVELKNINMMGTYLQPEVLKTLQKETSLKCLTENDCSGELPEWTIRYLAAFLSSVHQIYKFKTEEQTKAAVAYALKKIKELPEDKTAHDYKIYPWTYEDWLKVLAGVPPPKVKPPAKPKEVVAPEWKPYQLTPKPPFKVYRCTSLTKAYPTLVKQRYCQGVIGSALVDNDEKLFKFPGMLTGTAATLATKENKHDIGGLQVVFDSKWNTLYVTLPPELAKIKPLVGQLQQKPLHMATKDGVTFARYGKYAADKIATFLSHCSGIHLLPEWCQEAAVKYALQKGLQPIYPFSEKDWMDEVCAKVPGAPVVKPKPKPGELEKAILELLKPKSPAEWYTFLQIMTLLQEKYDIAGLDLEDILNKLVDEGKIEFSMAWGYKLVEKPPVLLDYSELSQDTVDDITDYICMAKDKGYTWTYTLEQVYKGFILQATPETSKLIVEQYNACPVKILKAVPPKPTIDELIEKSQETMSVLYLKISPEDLKKALEVKEYKKLPKKVKDWMHAKMNYDLLGGYKSKKPIDKTIESLQKFFLEHEAHKFKITPLMVKLQTDIEKKSKIRRGELPAEPGELISKKYEELPVADQVEIHDEIQSLIEEGYDSISLVLEKVTEKYGLETTQSLLTKITQMLGPVKEEMLYEDLELNDQLKVNDSIEQLVAQGKNFDQILGKIEEDYSLEDSSALVEKINEIMSEYFAQIKKVEELPKNIKDGVELQIYGMFLQGKNAEEITWEIVKEPYMAKTNISSSTILEYVVQKIGEYAVEKVPMQYFDQLSASQQTNIEVFMSDLIEAGIDKIEVLEKTRTEFNLELKGLPELYSKLKAELEEKAYLHYSEMPKEKQLGITSGILSAVQQGQGYEAIKEKIEMLYPELEWDAELGDMVDKLIMEWAEEKPKLVKILDIEVPEAFLEATKKTIIDGYEAGLSLPNIVQNAYSPTWQAVKPNVFKEWVKEIVEEYKKAEEKPKYYSDLPHKEQLNVTADIKKAKEKGTTKAELIQYLHEAYGIFTDTPLSDFINAIYKEKPPVPAVVEAINIIKGGKPYAGCYPQVPNVELNEPLVTYCQGILTLPWKHEAGFVRTATDEDIALLQAAAIIAQKQMPVVEHHGDGYRVTLTRTEPANIALNFRDAEKEGPHWKERQKAVVKTLWEKLGFDCSIGKETFSCSRTVSSPMTSHETRDLRRTAAFLSSLHDIDSLEPDCISQAVDYAYKSATLLEKGNKSLWKSMPYPYTVKEWKKKVCS